MCSQQISKDQKEDNKKRLKVEEEVRVLRPIEKRLTMVMFLVIMEACQVVGDGRK